MKNKILILGTLIVISTNSIAGWAKYRDKIINGVKDSFQSYSENDEDYTQNYIDDSYNDYYEDDEYDETDEDYYDNNDYENDSEDDYDDSSDEYYDDYYYD